MAERGIESHHKSPPPGMLVDLMLPHGIVRDWWGEVMATQHTGPLPKACYLHYGSVACCYLAVDAPACSRQDFSSLSFVI